MSRIVLTRTVRSKSNICMTLRPNPRTILTLHRRRDSSSHPRAGSITGLHVIDHLSPSLATHVNMPKLCSSQYGRNEQHPRHKLLEMRSTQTFGNHLPLLGLGGMTM